MGCHPATNCICVLSWCLVISHKVLGVMSKESPDSQPQRHWPVSPDWTHQPPLLDSRESQRERERDVAVGFLLMQMKSWDSVLSIISGAGHTVHHHLVPLLWAAPVLGHYLHQFSCCNQQMEQPQWKPFLSISEKRGSEVKGRQGREGHWNKNMRGREKMWKQCKKRRFCTTYKDWSAGTTRERGVYEEISKSGWDHHFFPLLHCCFGATLHKNRGK